MIITFGRPRLFINVTIRIQYCGMINDKADWFIYGIIKKETVQRQ